MSQQPQASNSGFDYKDFLLKYNIVFVLLAMCVFLSIYTENFLNRDNLVNITRQVSINGILAIGMTVVVLTGGIDLSVGSLVALAGVITAGLLRNQGLPIWQAIIIAVMCSIMLGAVSGNFVAYWRAAGFVALPAI